MDICTSGARESRDLTRSRYFPTTLQCDQAAYKHLQCRYDYLFVLHVELIEIL